jgi:hypothetical protein
MSVRGFVSMLACALVACSKGGDEPPAQPPSDTGTTFGGTFAIDIRGSIDVSMKQTGDVLDVELVGRDMDFAGFFAPEEKLHAKGTLERFPEADLTLYTGIVSLPARSASPCGAQPITMALSLSRRGTNLRLGGGLTAYCGDRAVGVPRRVFRITGSLS